MKTKQIIANRNTGIIHAGFSHERYQGVLVTFCGMEITGNNLSEPASEHVTKYMWSDEGMTPVDCLRCLKSKRNKEECI